MTITNTGLPVVTGTTTRGHTLATTDGEWTSDVTDTILVTGRKWRRCDATGANCVDIPGALAPRYTLISADIGSTVRSQITVSEVTSPPPPVPPPPPAPGAYTLDTLSDLNFVFVPGAVQPPVYGGTGGGGVFYQSTPYGDGFKIISTAQMPALWDAANGTFTKVCLAQGHPSNFWGELNSAESWAFNLYFPSPQSIPNLTNWHSGTLWEWHTSSASGHHLALNPNGTFRIGRLSSITGYQFTNGPAITYNTWIPVTYDIVWKQDGTGSLVVTINGTTYVNFTGQTDFNDGSRRLQFGWYADRQYTNTVYFGGITLTRT